MQIDEGVAKVLLQEHQESVCVLDPGPALSTATIRRNHIFSDVISQFKPVSFDPIFPFIVKFADEPGMDSGGPKRELFRLFKHSLQQQPHLFSSTDVGLVPMHNVQAVMNGEFEAVGKVLAISCLFGGPMLQCFSRFVAEFIVHDRVQSTPDVECISDHEIKRKILKVCSLSIS